jgi:serine/threonine protein kinase
MNEIRFDNYRLLERISHGGMAEVFRAKTFGAAGFEREVAIKLLLPTVAMDREFITMLIDEAKIAGQLTHANIAQIFDLGMAEGRYYIVQEYVRGKDLRAIIKHCREAKQPLSVAQACFIMMKVCEGLEYAHNKHDPNGQPLNLVHRDVSPQNVLVSMGGEVKLIDFGIAKAEGRATRTLAGLVKGKFAYMSPEQIRGLPVDRRSDVFACGIVMHELLTAKPLFLRKSEFETLKRARSGEIPPPSDLNPLVPEELDEIALSALARHLDERHQSAKAFREAIWDFVKQSGHFYSQAQLAEWMQETFETPPDENTATAVTTERDKKVPKMDDFSPAEATRVDSTEDSLRRMEMLTQDPAGHDLGTLDTSSLADPSSTMPDLPPQASRKSGRRPLLADRPPSDDRPGTSPSAFALAHAHRSKGEQRNASFQPVPLPQQQGFAEQAVAKSNEIELPPPQRKPVEEGQTSPPTNTFSNQRTMQYAGRRSRHSVRVLAGDIAGADDTAARTRERAREIEEPSARRRTNLLVAAAIFLLLLAGAASLTLSFVGGDDDDDNKNAPSQPSEIDDSKSE